MPDFMELTVGAMAVLLTFQYIAKPLIEAVKQRMVAPVNRGGNGSLQKQSVDVCDSRHGAIEKQFEALWKKQESTARRLERLTEMVNERHLAVIETLAQTTTELRQVKETLERLIAE